jgi:hypothetical protein
MHEVRAVELPGRQRYDISERGLFSDSKRELAQDTRQRHATARRWFVSQCFIARSGKIFAMEAQRNTTSIIVLENLAE